jgi:hypothetical protein
VAIVDNLWLAALTKDEDDAGTDDRFNLTINIDGIDVFVRDFVIGWRMTGAGTNQVLRTGLRDGQAGIENSEPLETPFETAGLTHSSVRLGIRGDDAWSPEHVLLIGRTQPAFEPGRIMALAMETEIGSSLSSDNDEGHLTMRLRLVSPGTSATVIQRVLLLIYTDAGNDVETDNSIQLQIGAGGGIVVHKIITDNLRPLTARWYVIDVETPFTMADMVANGSIRLSILGTDAWLPKTVFVFGLDTASGRPSEVVTLASVPEWGLGWLSTDPSEGSASIALPLSI